MHECKVVSENEMALRKEAKQSYLKLFLDMKKCIITYYVHYFLVYSITPCCICHYKVAKKILLIRALVKNQCQNYILDY